MLLPHVLCIMGKHFHLCLSALLALTCCCVRQDGDESAAGLLSAMLLLPGDFQPVSRAKLHNSSVHRALDSADVEVSVDFWKLRQGCFG